MQKPMQPMRPVTPSRPRRWSAAPSRSPSTVSSDIENSRAIIAGMSPVGGRAAFARVQVDAERHVADVGEAVGDVADVLAEAAGLVDHDRSPGWLAASAGARGSR